MGRTETSEKFKPGDVVSLKSGGPSMSLMRYYNRVVNLSGEEKPASWKCGWFTEDKFHMAEISEDALVRIHENVIDKSDVSNDSPMSTPMEY